VHKKASINGFKNAKMGGRQGQEDGMDDAGGGGDGGRMKYEVQ
jgi:hypothetical protein